MSTIIKLICTLGLVVMLGSCATSKPISIVQPEKRVEINIQQTKPTKLNVVQFKVIELDGKLFVVMDMDNYEKLAKNMELLQAKIVEDKKVIENLKKYYEKK